MRDIYNEVVDSDGKPVWANKPEIAAHFRVCERTIEEWMRKKIIPFSKPSARIVRFNIEKCDAAIAEYAVSRTTFLNRKGNI